MPRVGRQPRMVDHTKGPDQTLRPLPDGREILQRHSGHHEGLRRLGEPDVEVARRRTFTARQDELVSGHEIRTGSRDYGRTLQFGDRFAAMAIRAEIRFIMSCNILRWERTLEI